MPPSAALRDGRENNMIMSMFQKVELRDNADLPSKRNENDFPTGSTAQAALQPCSCAVAGQGLRIQ